VEQAYEVMYVCLCCRSQQQALMMHRRHARPLSSPSPPRAHHGTGVTKEGECKVEEAWKRLAQQWLWVAVARRQDQPHQRQALALEASALEALT